MQSTNTTHNKNFKNPKKCSFSAIAKPIEDPVSTIIKMIEFECDSSLTFFQVNMARLHDMFITIII